MVVPPHRDGGQAQFVDQPLRHLGAGDPFARTLVWAQEHVGDPLSVSDLASRAAMSPRTFARHLRAIVGTTPHQWLLRQRVVVARRLLETTDTSIDVTVDRCGRGTSTNMRHQRIVRTSPDAYRRTFREAAAG